MSTSQLKNNNPNKTPEHHQIDILTGSLSRKKPLGLSKHGGFTRHLTFGSGSSARELSHRSRDKDMCDLLVSPLYFPRAHRLVFCHSCQLKPEQSRVTYKKEEGREWERKYPNSKCLVREIKGGSAIVPPNWKFCKQQNPAVWPNQISCDTISTYWKEKAKLCLR